MYRVQKRKDDPGITARVRPTKVRKLDALLAGTDRHLVFERATRKKPGFVSGELLHLLHVRLRVLVSDELHIAAEEIVAAGVIVMRMRVDDHRHRFLGDGLHLVENR